MVKSTKVVLPLRKVYIDEFLEELKCKAIEHYGDLFIRFEGDPQVLTASPANPDRRTFRDPGACPQAPRGITPRHRPKLEDRPQGTRNPPADFWADVDDIRAQMAKLATCLIMRK